MASTNMAPAIRQAPRRNGLPRTIRRLPLAKWRNGESWESRHPHNLHTVTETCEWTSDTNHPPISAHMDLPRSSSCASMRADMGWSSIAVRDNEWMGWPVSAVFVEILESLSVACEIVACDPALPDTAPFCAPYGYALGVPAKPLWVAW